MEASKVGMRIQEARKARGLTQAELSQIVDLTPNYLSNMRGIIFAFDKICVSSTFFCGKVFLVERVSA